MSLLEALDLSELQIKMNPDNDNPESQLTVAFKTTAHALNNAGVDFALVGGIALAQYIEPRGTKDLDFIALAKDKISVIKALTSVGFKRHPKSGVLKSLGNAECLMFKGPFPNANVRVDIIISDNEFFRMSIQRAKYNPAVKLKIAPIETLIVLKYLAFEDRSLSINEDERNKSGNDWSDYRKLISSRKYNYKFLQHLASKLGLAWRR